MKFFNMYFVYTITQIHTHGIIAEDDKFSWNLPTLFQCNYVAGDHNTLNVRSNRKKRQDDLHVLWGISSSSGKQI